MDELPCTPAEAAGPQPAIPARRFPRRELLFLAGLLLFALVLRVNLRQGQVSGESMEPTYRNGDTILIWKTAPRSGLKPGDVVVFRDTNGEELIKRIAFIRSIRQPGSPPGSYVHPNGGRLIPYSLLFDDYFRRIGSGQAARPSPKRTIYVLGDNLIVSDDSRHIGPIAPEQILGKVIP